MVVVVVSGRSPTALTLQRANDDGFSETNPFPQQHGHPVTVPGAAAAWADAVANFGGGTVSGPYIGPSLSIRIDVGMVATECHALSFFQIFLRPDEIYFQAGLEHVFVYTCWHSLRSLFSRVTKLRPFTEGRH